MLKSFYLNKGYYKVKVKNTFSQLLNKKDFSLIFNIDAGDKYYFNDFKLLIPDNYDKSKFVKITGSGIIEGHPHNVIITKEAPNYSPPKV